MRKVIITVFMLVLSFTVFGTNANNRMNNRNQPNPCVQYRRLLNDNNLSAEQKNSIDAVTERYAEVFDNLSDRLTQLRRELRDLLRENSPDRNRIRAIVQSTSEVEADIKYNRIVLNLDIMSFLTDEQKSQYLRQMRRIQHHSSNNFGNF